MCDHTPLTRQKATKCPLETLTPDEPQLLLSKFVERCSQRLEMRPIFWPVWIVVELLQRDWVLNVLIHIPKSGVLALSDMVRESMSGSGVAIAEWTGDTRHLVLSWGDNAVSHYHSTA